MIQIFMKNFKSKIFFTNKNKFLKKISNKNHFFKQKQIQNVSRLQTIQTSNR